MVSEKCKICGRKLKNPLYQKIGFGKVCYERLMKQKVKYKKLFDTNGRRK